MYGHPSMCITHARALAPSARVFYAWLATRQADLFHDLFHGSVSVADSNTCPEILNLIEMSGSDG